MDNQFGIKEGKIIHVNDVDSGLTCGAKCLVCGEQLIAKKGDKNIHHFSHNNVDTNCSNESTIHLLAKYYLINIHDKRLRLPGYGIDSLMKMDIGNCEHVVEPPSKCNDNHTFLDFTGVSEVGVGEFRPDITLFHYGGTKLHVEVCVTNPVSPIKLQKVVDHGEPMVQIDMSAASLKWSKQEFIDYILYNAPREWVYHPYKEHLKEQMKVDLDFKIELAEQQILNRANNKYGHYFNL